MAPKKSKEPEETKEDVKPSEVRASIGAKKLKSLMSAARSSAKDMSAISGTLGQKIAAAVENDHLHRKAFSVVRQADKLEPEKLAEFLDCLEHYLDISGLNERASKVQSMSFGPGGEAGEDEAEEGEGRGGRTVRAFPRPSSVAAE